MLLFYDGCSQLVDFSILLGPKLCHDEKGMETVLLGCPNVKFCSLPFHLFHSNVYSVLSSLSQLRHLTLTTQEYPSYSKGSLHEELPQITHLTLGNGFDECAHWEYSLVNLLSL